LWYRTTEPFIVNNVTPNAPAVVDQAICNGDSASLSVTASGNVRWFDELGNLVNTGLTYITPILSQNTTYFVENTDSYNDTVFAEPHTNGIGGGGYTTSAQYNIFNAHEGLTIKSALVYAQSAGNLTIKLQDELGQDLQSVVATVPAGMSRVTLNFPVAADSNLRLGVTAMTVSGLYRNNNSATFPYDLNNSLSITGSSAGASYYYYLYDWEILTQNGQCSSAQIPLNVLVNSALEPISSDVTICQGESAILTATGSGILNWYNSAGELVGSGTTLTTNALTSNTAYTVVNVVNGCVSTPTNVNVTVEACANIPELSTIQESLLLSPNPTTGQFIVSFISKETGPVTVKISDLQGKEINTKSSTVISGINEIGMNLDKAAKGTYLVTIEYKNHSFLRRIIKQ